MKPNPRIIKRSYNFLELEDGWMRKETGQVYKSFAGASQALKREAKAAIDNNVGDTIFVQTITWEPTTNVGRIIVKALTVNQVTK